MEKTYYSEMKNNIDNLIRNGKLNGRNVFIFGHCNASEEMIDYLENSGIKINAVLDNNSAKWGMAYKSVAVKKPDVICSFEDSDCIVLIAAKAYESMVKQLRGLGYGGRIVKAVDYNSFAEFSLSDDTFNEKKEKVLRGAETLKKIRKLYPLQHLVICPYAALGDVYTALSFLPQYCLKNKIKSTAVLVVGNACRQVAEMFDTGNVMALDRAAMDELIQAVLFTEEKNCIIAHHDRPYTNDNIRCLDKHFVSFDDCYRFGVYGLPEEAQPALPTKAVPFKSKEQIEKNNTVILSPYAKSMVQLPETFWKTMAEDYEREGRIVCTNVAGDEKPVKGTKALSIPINQMISAAEYAGCFVGIRSGLCDILSTAKCNKTVVFPDCIYSTTGVKVADFFDMPGWNKIVYSE